MYIASKDPDGPWGHYGPQTATDLIIQISVPIYLPVHIAYMVWALLEASEATTASKQPQRSDKTSDLISVSLITYISTCILIFWYGPF